MSEQINCRSAKWREVYLKVKIPGIYLFTVTSTFNIPLSIFDINNLLIFYSLFSLR